MADRGFSVVVLPDVWEGSLDELARKMMPVTGRGPNQVLPLLKRGPMTMEADLGVEEAKSLQARLNRLGAPAKIVDDAGDLVADSAHRAASNRSSSDAPRESSSAAAGPWGEVLADEDDSGAVVEDLDELEYFDDFDDFDDLEDIEDIEDIDDIPELAGLESSDKLGANQSGAHKSGVSRDVDAHVRAGASFGAEPASPGPSAAGDGQPGGAEASSETDNPPPEQPRSPGPSNPDQRPADQRPPDQRPADQPGLSQPGQFNADRMSDALRAEGAGRPPYAPDGFDDRVEHIPALAALLSLLAPGAGQIYNGQGDKSSTYGVRFALIRPWFASVRQAWTYAEKIRTYWAPWPKPGALAAAGKYALAWWAIFGTVVAGLGWAGTRLYEVARPPKAPTFTAADVDEAVGRAIEGVHEARIAALDGVAAARDRQNRARPRFTMSDAERAKRLFNRGLDYCKLGNYATCASAMKRVTSLSPKLGPKAYRLQAWASVRQSDGSRQPMPDVAPVELAEAPTEADPAKPPTTKQGTSDQPSTKAASTDDQPPDADGGPPSSSR